MRGNHPSANGGKWCRPTTRLAIYLRDGLSCVYCGEALEEGAHFTLDHVLPFSKKGGNAPSNLVTCCKRCNSARGNRSIFAWAKAVAIYLNHGVTENAVLKHVLACTKRDLNPFRIEARKLIALRGTAAKALSAFRSPSHGMHEVMTKAIAPVVVLGAEGREAGRKSNLTQTSLGDASVTKRGGQRSAKTKAAPRSHRRG